MREQSFEKINQWIKYKVSNSVNIQAIEESNKHIIEYL